MGSTKAKYYSKTAFSDWLYNAMEPVFDGNTDVQDIDFVIFNYLTGDIMTLEAKERNGSVKANQRDTQNVIKQLLSFGTVNSCCDTLRGVRPIKYHGHHVIQFQNTTPDDGSVKLDGKLINQVQLIKFLNFGRSVQNGNDN